MNFSREQNVRVCYIFRFPMARVTIYHSSVPGSLKVRKDQQRVQDLLTMKKIAFDMVDVSVDEDGKNYMVSCG